MSKGCIAASIIPASLHHAYGVVSAVLFVAKSVLHLLRDDMGREIEEGKGVGGEENRMLQ